jgi:hypothetical protein
MCKEIGAYLTGEARVFGNKRCRCWCILYNVREEKGDDGGPKIAVIPMQMMMRSSKKRRFPIQILRRLLPGSMPRRLHKTHHLRRLYALKAREALKTRKES